jgi:hypothetical protein
MNKQRQTAILENWFGIDKIIFGGNSKNVLDEETYTRYCTTKGAFLSNLFEIYSRVGYTPNKSYRNVNEMANNSIALATNAIQKAKQILQTEGVNKIIREEIRETSHLENLSESEIARYVVTKRRNAVAIDALTMSSALSENKDAMNDWHSKVLVDAHKTLRDSLIEMGL